MPGTFSESKVRRGQPKNRGEFASKGGTGGAEGAARRPSTSADVLGQARDLERQANDVTRTIGSPGLDAAGQLAAGHKAKGLRQQAKALRAQSEGGFDESKHPRGEGGKFAPKAWKDADPETLAVHAKVLALAEDPALKAARAKSAEATAVRQQAEKDYDEAVRKIPRARRKTHPVAIEAKAKLDAAAQADLDARIDSGTARVRAAAKAREALYAPEGPAALPLASITSAGGTGADLTKDQSVRDGHDFFVRVAGRGSPVERSRIMVAETKDRRAFADQDRATVNLNAASDKSTVAHEYAHHLEFNSPALAAECVAFREARRVASGEQYRPMAEIDPGGRYSPDEKAFGDGWLSPYTGKDYGDNTTEIMSMGFTHLHEDPIGFAQKDPEHFQFVLSTLRKYRGGTGG